jgi:hypothetical protein
MTTNELRIGPAKQLGPLQVWPLIWEGLIAHNYKSPPNLDSLIFGEIEDEDGPIVDCIQVENPTDDPFIIPSGWIISANLWQDRTVNSMEYIEPHATVAFSVSCVEKARWSPESKSIGGGRAPFSVIAAGFEFDATKGFWDMNACTRQSRVWTQVSRQETRSGFRPTNSLRQVMEEDSLKSEIQSSVFRELQGRLISHPRQNGVLIALEGQPLVAEFFSNPNSLKSTLRETVIAASFDATSNSKMNIGSDEVRRFFLDFQNYKNIEIASDHWGAMFAGGSQEIDARISVNKREEILHLSAINRNHRVLLEV